MTDAAKLNLDDLHERLQAAELGREIAVEQRDQLREKNERLRELVDDARRLLSSLSNSRMYGVRAKTWLKKLPSEDSTP